MTWSVAVKDKALVACGRHCCLCHKFCGLKIELHHIVQEAEGGKASFENCIPLCFNCHGDMRSYDHKHPKGTKYSAAELTAHRDKWYAKVRDSVAGVSFSDTLPVDREIFKRLVSLLPWSGSINFVRLDGLTIGSFDLDRLDDFWRFLHECNDPGFEFLDADLEGCRVDLIARVNALAALVGSETFINDHTGRSSIPPEWEFQRFRDATQKLQAASSEVCSAYDQLVRLARRKLAPTRDDV